MGDCFWHRDIVTRVAVEEEVIPSPELWKENFKAIDYET